MITDNNNIILLHQRHSIAMVVMSSIVKVKKAVPKNTYMI
jgi:hypothetical protein